MKPFPSTITFPLMLTLALACVLTSGAAVTVSETPKRLMLENESVRLVFNGALEDCTYGMTLGHNDSDNLIRDNDIRRSSEAGIHFRGGNKAFAPHRNRFELNRIVDNGGEKGVAIDINGETESVVIFKNELRETREPKSRIGIRIGAETSDIRYEDNQIEGFAIPISDLRKEGRQAKKACL